MSSNDYLYKQTVKSGTVISLSEALSSSGFKDTNGNSFRFTEPLPKYYVENNGFSYSLEGLDKALVTLRIEKIPEGQQQQIEEKQQKEPNALQSTTRITSKSRAK